MPKEKTSIAYKLKQAVKNNKYLRTEGDVRICTICEKKINFSHQHGSQRLSEHLKSRNHLQKVDIKDKPKTQTLLRDVFNCEQSTSNDQTQFNKDMTKAFLSADIPFHKLNNFYFKNFLKKYIDFAIPEESTLRKNYAKDVYEDTLQKIRNTIGEKDIVSGVLRRPLGTGWAASLTRVVRSSFQWVLNMLIHGMRFEVVGISLI